MTPKKGVLSGWRPWHVDAAGAAALAGMLIAAYVVGIQPALHRRASRVELAAQRDQEVEKADGLGAALRRVTDRLEETQHALDTGEIALESAQGLNRRLARLTGVGTDNHLKIDTIEPGKTARLPCYDALEITISGRGAFTDCAAFLHELYVDVPDTEVVAVELTGEPGAADNVAGFKLVLSWFTTSTAKLAQQ